MAERMKTILTTPMVIAIMAFALVAFLLLIDTSIMPRGGKKVEVKNTTTSTTNTNTTVTNTNSTTEGTFLTNTNSNTNGAAE